MVYMKQRDLVELIRDRDEYLKKGVKKGCYGGIVSEKKENNKWQVLFLDIEKLEAIAFIPVYENDLKILENENNKKALSCDGEVIKEFDFVEVVNDKDLYKKEGINKGMTGVICHNKHSGGYWLVDFSDHRINLHDLNISILGNDLKIIRESY
jgi:hypothetical protein